MIDSINDLLAIKNINTHNQRTPYEQNFIIHVDKLIENIEHRNIVLLKRTLLQTIDALHIWGERHDCAQICYYANIYSEFSYFTLNLIPYILINETTSPSSSPKHGH